MGAWGTAVFADDLAADVRGDWRDGILDGVEARALTHSLIDAYEANIADPDDGIVFWMALAAAQQESGRLVDLVRDRALDLLAAGGDVERWAGEDQSLGRQREKALAKLRAALLAPQPAPKRLRRAPILGVSFDVGDVLCLDAPSGARAAAVVVALRAGYPKGALDPVVELLDWDGTGPFPSREALGTLAVIHTDEEASLLDARPARVRPHLFVVTTARKDQQFGSEIGWVVEKGVERVPAGDLRDGSLGSGDVVLTWTSWAGVIRTLGSPRFEKERNLGRAMTHTAHRKPWWRWPNTRNREDKADKRDSAISGAGLVRRVGSKVCASRIARPR